MVGQIRLLDTKPCLSQVIEPLYEYTLLVYFVTLLLSPITHFGVPKLDIISTFKLSKCHCCMSFMVWNCKPIQGVLVGNYCRIGPQPIQVIEDLTHRYKQNQQASGERAAATTEPVALIVYILLLRRPPSQLIADNRGRTTAVFESMDLGCDLRGSEAN